MNVLDAIATRKSIRAYQPTPIEPGKLAQLLEAVRQAPSAANNQPLQFYIIQTEAIKAQLKPVLDDAWLFTAPMIVCGCYNKNQSYKDRGREFGEIDVIIAMDHLILAATSLGLGTCWVGSFNTAGVRKVLDLPDYIVPVVLTPLGYPAEVGNTTARKPVNQLFKRV